VNYLQARALRQEVFGGLVSKGVPVMARCASDPKDAKRGEAEWQAMGVTPTKL
jgi:hypothetical protein